MSIHEGTEKLAHALLLPINPAAVVILGMYTVLWGLWVASPFWDVFARAPLYSALASTTVPEFAWGILAIVCGLITIYGSYKRRYGPLTRGAGVSWAHWSMIAIFYFMGDPLNTGGITALTFAFYSAYIYLNIRVNCKTDKKKAEILL
jgi:hypothetical protein